MPWLASALAVVALLPGAAPPAASPGAAPPAAAPGVAPLPGKATVLAAWTKPTAASFQQWNAARLAPGTWAGYGFVWTTDFCSRGPDRPAGFDFRPACRRHDFGYRNYRAIGALAANKPRLDRMLHADLQRICGTYRLGVRPVCNLLAWTYYRAARKFGTH
jgi:Prokaryotic phospholipase A2